MNNDDKEIRLDREPDEERKSEFPLGDNTVKTTNSPAVGNAVGFQDNQNLKQTRSADLEGSPEVDTTTKTDE